MIHFSFRGFRGGLHWYDPIFLGLAAVMVWPDQLLDWIGTWTGKTFHWWHVVLVEVVFGGLMAGAFILLRLDNPELRWWSPLIYLGVVAMFRGIIWFITEMVVGSDD